MGQAKRRGTFEQRLALAQEKQTELLKQANLALTKPSSHLVGVIQSNPLLVSAALLAITGLPTHKK